MSSKKTETKISAKFEAPQGAELKSKIYRLPEDTLLQNLDHAIPAKDSLNWENFHSQSDLEMLKSLPSGRVYYEFLCARDSGHHWGRCHKNHHLLCPGHQTA